MHQRTTSSARSQGQEFPPAQLHSLLHTSVCLPAALLRYKSRIEIIPLQLSRYRRRRKMSLARYGAGILESRVQSPESRVQSPESWDPLAFFLSTTLLVVYPHTRTPCISTYASRPKKRTPSHLFCCFREPNARSHVSAFLLAYIRHYIGHIYSHLNRSSCYLHISNLLVYILGRHPAD